MENIDLLLVGGGRKQSEICLRECLTDVSESLPDLVTRGCWIDRCGHWWLLDGQNLISVGWWGNRLVEFNTGFQIGGEIGRPVKWCWPLFGGQEFSEQGIGGLISFQGVNLVGSGKNLCLENADWNKFPQEILDDQDFQNDKSELYLIGFAGGKNFLPSKLGEIHDNGLVVKSGNYNLERFWQNFMIDMIKNKNLSGSGLLELEIEENSWRIKTLNIFVDISRSSQWAQLWFLSGLRYDIVIRKVFNDLSMNGE